MEHRDHRNADFSERAVAFALDLAPFAAGWALTLKALSPATPVLINPLGARAWLMWVGIFLAYQAYFSSEGRVTLGKAMTGLRVVGSDGEPLDLTRGIIRSLGYVVSQLFLGGFLWSLLDPNGRALHDLPIGSLVVAAKPLRAEKRLLFRAAGGLLLVGFALVSGWKEIWAPRYDRILTVAHAQHALKEYATLQESYKLRNGRYADTLYALATVSSDPQGFLGDAYLLYDGGRVGFKLDRGGYTIVARANDTDKTLVAVSGP